MARRNEHSATEIRSMILCAGRTLIREAGIKGLRARAIADRVGYTVGTLYHVFENLDDITEHINAETLRGLRNACTSGPIPDAPTDALRVLAARYNSYVSENQNLWNAVIGYPFAAAHERSEDYKRVMHAIMNMICAATSPLYPPGEEDLQLHEARMLWSCLYGVHALDKAGRQASGETAAALTESVIEMFVRSKQLAD